MRWLALILISLIPTSTWSETSTNSVQQCLSCHLNQNGSIDIVGLAALDALPPEWPLLFEDAFDLNGDGVAGQMRIVSGGGQPLVAKYGSKLAAARFQDFALIAGALHGIALEAPEKVEVIKAEFYARSPAPLSPFANESELLAFEARQCSACHVTRSFVFEGKQVMPLSDFLLHDLGNGPKRTAPLWGCKSCVSSEHDPHAETLR